MILPEGYDPKNFVRDPNGRNNHLYCPETDEVLSVDTQTYREILGIKAPKSPTSPSPNPTMETNNAGN